MNLNRRAITKLQAIVIIFIIVVAAISGVVYWYFTQQPTGPETVRIGVLMPLTGGMAQLGRECLDGYKIAAQEVNEEGGIKSLGGAEVELVIADVQSDAEVAMSECERLINIEHLTVILGTYSSYLSMAATPVAEKYHTIYWETNAGADDLTERGLQYLFRACANASVGKLEFVDLLRDVIIPKIGVSYPTIGLIYLDNEWGVSSAKSVREVVARGFTPNLEIVGEEPYAMDAMDLSPGILRLKDAAPDIVFSFATTTDSILLHRQMKELDFNVKMFIGMGGGHNQVTFAEALGSDADYVCSTSYWNIDIMVGDSEKLKAMHLRMFGTPLASLYVANNYAGAKLLFLAIEKAGSMDPDKIKEAALTIDIPEPGILGWGCKFNPVTHHNDAATVVVTQWQNAELYTVYPDVMATKEIWAPTPPWSER